MPLIDTVSGNRWSPEHTNAMNQYVRRLCRDELRRQDEEAGIPPNGQVCVTNEKGHYVVDAELAKKKSSYRELRNLHTRRWELFCSAPQDEKRCEELGFFLSPKDVTAQEARLAEARAECPDESVNNVVIPGLDDVAGSDVPASDVDVDGKDTEPAPAGEAPKKRDPQRRRRFGR